MGHSDKKKEKYIRTIIELQKENEALKGQINSSLSENKLNLILENAGEGIFGLDVDGNHTFINRKAANLLGYEPADLIGKNSHSIWHYKRPDGSLFPKEECPIFFTLKDGKKHVGESYFWRKDGFGFYVDYSSMPIFDNDLITGAVITFSDITGRKIAFEEIIRLQRAVESSGEVIFITDLNGLITYINPEFTNLYGFTADEVIGKTTPRILKSGAMAAETYKYFWDTLLNKDVIKVEIINKTKDGRLLNIEGSANPILNDQKEIIGFIGIQHDITSRKLAEDEIKLKNELLQTINAEKDKFFSIISHDLRDSLSAFVNTTQLITEEIHTMELEEIIEITGSMKISANNLYNLLVNFLEWSKLKRDGMAFVPEKLNIKEKIGDCIDVLSESARRKRMEVSFSIPDEMEVFADNHMFDTIFRNLLSNAIKFTHVGGKVNVTADYNSDHSILIKISDSGIGMPAELKNKLFLISERTGRTGTEGEMSTGLGLLLVKEFIEKHGGKIWVESEAGYGSTFSFTLPEMIKETLSDKVR
ncbi:MAG TPA: hypothetical protein DDW27_04745 [Bacteroidales bacterium]|nr:hypothetical protein [Bacteroidales bacterium]